MLRSLLIALFFVSAVPAQADDEYEWEAQRIHSDLPLYTFDWEDTWPRSMDEPDIIAGCESRVAFGDWKFTPHPNDEYGEPYWSRISNYGMFHCAANLRESDSREELEDGEFSRGLFAKIGRSKAGGKTYELWVLQVGFVPGSDYMLLARENVDKKIVEEFRVLQRRCPRKNMRSVDGMDIWLTDYCAINSRAEMLWLAKRMLREPALGTFTRVENEEPDETPGPPETD